MSVIGIDMDETLIAAARARIAAARLDNITLLAVDAFAIADNAKDQDFVFIANTFHGVGDKTALAAAVNLSLGARGSFAIVNWHALPHEQTKVLNQPRGPSTELRMTPHETIAAVLPAGFETERIVDVSPFHYTAVFRKLS